MCINDMVKRMVIGKWSIDCFCDIQLPIIKTVSFFYILCFNLNKILKLSNMRVPNYNW